MRIAVIFPKDSEALFSKKSSRTFGGASAQMYLIAKELGQRKDIECFSIIPEYPVIDFEEQKYFKLVKAYKENSNMIIKSFSFLSVLFRLKPDVIIQHGLTPFTAILAMFAKELKIKFVYMFAHDVEVTGRYQEQERYDRLFAQLLSNSYLIITQNKYQQEYLLKHYNTPSLKLYNGFPILPKSSTSSKGYVLWVGRCTHIKHPEDFVTLAQQFPEHKFVMICLKSTDEKFYNEVKERAEKTANIKFLSFVPFSHIQKYFNEAMVFVSTSEREGYPQTFIQAMLAGIPLVSTHLVDPDGVIDKNELGLVNETFEQLVTDLKTVLTDKRLYEKFCSNSYNFAKVNHNISVNMDSLLAELTHNDTVSK